MLFSIQMAFSPLEVMFVCLKNHIMFDGHNITITIIIIILHITYYVENNWIVSVQLNKFYI